MQNNEAMRVVIIGGGFGGLSVARGLAGSDIDVTLVDRRNFHLFQPLLYQVATGGLSPANIAAPLRSILRGSKNVNVLLADVTGVDPDNHKLLLQDGDLDYDYLIVATGSSHHYFGHPEWEVQAPGLKTIEDALNIRCRLLSAFETAERLGPGEASRSWLNFVIVGGGPTGVELAGAIAEMAHLTLQPEYHAIRPADARVILVEAESRLLPTFPAKLSEKARTSLMELGAEARLNTLVESVDDDGVDVRVGDATERIEAKTVLWAAGVRATPPSPGLAQALGAEADRGGHIRVSPDLRVPGRPEVFIIGDLALVEQDGKPLPAVATVAIQQGEYVARLLKARADGHAAGRFRYRSKGTLATIGHARAVADFGPIKLWGYPAWAIWLVVHIMNIERFENRLLVLLQWGWNYFARSRSARLITRPYQDHERDARDQAKADKVTGLRSDK
jgi:NADH dehydrogenase